MIKNSNLAASVLASYLDKDTMQKFFELLLAGHSLNIKQSPFSSRALLVLTPPSVTPLQSIAVEMNAVRNGNLTRPVRIYFDAFLPDTFKRAIRKMHDQFVNTTPGAI